jgi:uncharacterized protein with PIN domain
VPPSDGADIRFVADAMLGSLTRKLRALGFDTSYYRSGEDSGIVRLAQNDARAILTSDQSLAGLASSKGLKVFLVEGRNDGDRISSISQAAAASGARLVRGQALCSLCNGELMTLRRADVQGKVPPSVSISHRLFYRCMNCGQYYWHGSHWKKLRSLSRRLEPK